MMGWTSEVKRNGVGGRDSARLPPSWREFGSICWVPATSPLHVMQSSLPRRYHSVLSDCVLVAQVLAETAIFSIVDV
jgi:hypothetical protein